MPIPEAISTTEAPAAVGPYSQAVRCGDLLYISGQIPLDPQSGEMVGETIEEQTERVLKNLEAVLKSQKLGFKNLVKTTVFLDCMEDFSRFNKIYEQFMTRPFPARATIEVGKLPKNALIEIEAIACYAYP